MMAPCPRVRSTAFKRYKYLYLVFLSLIFFTFHLLTPRSNCVCDCTLFAEPIRGRDNQVTRSPPIRKQIIGSQVHGGAATKLTVEDLEFNINVSRSIRDSIEGNLWNPLPGYRNRCWAEKLRGGSVSGGPQPPPVRILSARLNRTVAYVGVLRNRTLSGDGWRMRCLPRVYLIGVTKSGTSDFHKYLTTHHQVSPAAAKEIHYWNARRFPRAVRLHSFETRRTYTFDQYLSFFDVAAHEINTSVVLYENGSVWHPKVTVDGSIAMLWEDNGWTQIPGNRGQVAPLYTTAATLAHFQPEAKLIVLLREPVERLYSYYRMFTGRDVQRNPEIFHNKTIGVLSEYKECLRVYNIRECAYSGQIEKLSRIVNIRSSLYSTFLADWMKVFPKNQFHVIRSEDYYADRRTFLENTVKFIGLDPYKPETAASLKEAPILFKNDHYIPMLSSTRRVLQNFFKPFIKELEEMFGRTFWSYDD